MGAFLVVQLDVRPDGLPGMADRLVRFQLDLFILDTAPHPLDEHVVAPTAFAIHRQPDTTAQHGLGESAGRELAALISVHDVGSSVAGECFLERFDSVQASSVMATRCASTLRLTQSTTAVRYTKPRAIGI